MFVVHGRVARCLLRSTSSSARCFASSMRHLWYLLPFNNGSNTGHSTSTNCWRSQPRPGCSCWCGSRVYVENASIPLAQAFTGTISDAVVEVAQFTRRDEQMLRKARVSPAETDAAAGNSAKAIRLWRCLERGEEGVQEVAATLWAKEMEQASLTPRGDDSRITPDDSELLCIERSQVEE